MNHVQELSPDALKGIIAGIFVSFTIIQIRDLIACVIKKKTDHKTIHAAIPTIKSAGVAEPVTLDPIYYADEFPLEGCDIEIRVPQKGKQHWGVKIFSPKPQRAFIQAIHARDDQRIQELFQGFMERVRTKHPKRKPMTEL